MPKGISDERFGPCQCRSCVDGREINSLLDEIERQRKAIGHFETERQAWANAADAQAKLVRRQREAIREMRACLTYAVEQTERGDLLLGWIHEARRLLEENPE